MISEAFVMRYKTAEINGLKLFYREAGSSEAPIVLLLHGFPSSSHMNRDLMPRLADRYHVIARDYPGSGYSEEPCVRSTERSVGKEGVRTCSSRRSPYN